MRYCEFAIRRLMALMALFILVVILAIPAMATQNTVYPFGRADVTVPVNQYLNVSAPGAAAQIWKQTGGPSTNSPVRFARETTVTTNGRLVGREAVFGPYTTGDIIIRIEAGADPVYYSVGALAASLPVLRNIPRPAYTQLAPVTYTTTQTLLASDLMAGIITGTQSSGGIINYTLPTGTLTDTATGLQIGMGFEWSLINLSSAAADIIQLTAGSGHTIVGTVNVASVHSTTGGLYGSSSRWYTRKTAANTFITYRIR